MGDSQENNKGKSRDKDNYVSWTMEDTNELLHLLVDAMNRGLRDANGSLSKQNVERIILPQLNAKTKFPKTYSHYLSQMKWFRNQYNMMSTLMRNNSGFGWDPIGKTFTAHEDVWKDYLKSHPSHSKLRGKSMVDYEYLKIVVGGGVSSRNNSISVDPDDTDATTFEPENRTVGIEEFSYDPNSDTFITPNNYEPAYQPPSPNQPSPPSHPPLDSEIVGQNTRYCVIRNTFGRSQFATSENFHKILKALNSLAPDLMVRPGSTVPAKIRESTRFYPYFKDCIGAIDGTHIPASVKGRDVSSYRDRHGNISQNVLAACNFDLEFMYVLSGWEGSAHDSKVLSDVLARKNGLKVPQGHGNDPENEKELFNLRHASLRNVIERIFGIFKSRFTIFKSAPPFLFKTQVELVLACAALHNFLRKECRSDEFPVEPTDESSSSSSVLPNYEDNDHEPIVQTQEQEREDANIWRTNIGSDMWRNANN
ncbi:uncharacterized protein [Glycine max]|uniref:uncharacterized protein n=1 Tax=Glycine max TaxID=3847 RepID=UPI001B35506E|nr:uncharacterized protein LOC102669241 [Glycine max]